MMAWWAALPLLKQFFLVVAIPSTVILLIQSIMTFAGMGGDHDADGGGLDGGHDISHDLAGGHDGGHDFGHGQDAPDAFQTAGTHAGDAGHAAHGLDGFRFFTIRGIVAFLAVFGWTGSAVTGALHPAAVLAISTAAGLVAMGLVAFAFWGILQLQAKGNLDYRYSIGLQGEVYLTVPPQRSGMGKVSITLQERLVEADAITDETEKLSTGSRIRVVGLEGNNVLLVSKEWEGHQHADQHTDLV